MKKFLFMLLMSISVAIFAVPPPAVTDVIADQVQYVVQDEVQTIDATAQEIAYVYTGDMYLYSCQLHTAELEQKLEFPELIMNDELLAYNDELNRPPANIDLMGLVIDKQNCNYGYPLTAN